MKIFKFSYTERLEIEAETEEQARKLMWDELSMMESNMGRPLAWDLDEVVEKSENDEEKDWI